MNVEELIEKLSACDPKAKVIFVNSSSSYSEHGAQRGGGLRTYLETIDIVKVEQKVIPCWEETRFGGFKKTERSFRVVLLSYNQDNIERAACDLEIYGRLF